MKFKLGKNDKDESDCYYLKKNKRENILVSGSVGSGAYHLLLSMLSAIIKDNKIDSSIIISEYKKDEVLAYSYNLLDTLNLGHKFEFIDLTSINDNSCLISISNYINWCLKNKKHIFITPPLDIEPLRNKNFLFFIELLKKLNIKENQTPIVMENISKFNIEEIELYNSVVQELNKKNYFFITRILGLKDTKFSYIHMTSLELTHPHFLMLRQRERINKNDVLFKEIYILIKKNYFHESIDFFYFYNKKNMFQKKYKIFSENINNSKVNFLKNYTKLSLKRQILQLTINDF
jgi:hypothetical protein